MTFEDKIYNLNSFKRQYKALLALSVCETIPNLDWETDRDELLKLIDWNNLLGIASALSYSSDSRHLEAALRIAQTCLLQKECSEEQKNGSAVILGNLTNNVAIDMAVKKDYLKNNYEDSYSFVLKLQKMQLDFEYSVFFKDKLLYLNRFQKEVYDACQLNDVVSISAPTSAGKSFILCNIILEMLLKGNRNIIYLVPTRALISQVESDLRELLKKEGLDNVNISTIPSLITTDDKNQSNIFVFTQERLHWFLTDYSNLKLDLLVIDEAHKIDDKNRVILAKKVDNGSL